MTCARYCTMVQFKFGKAERSDAWTTLENDCICKKIFLLAPDWIHWKKFNKCKFLRDWVSDDAIICVSSLVKSYSIYYHSCGTLSASDINSKDLFRFILGMSCINSHNSCKAGYAYSGKSPGEVQLAMV